MLSNVAERNKNKYNLYTPGTNIKIRDPKILKKTNTEYLLILSWNIKNEIIKQEKNFVKHGGKFIIPFPKPKILD